MKKTARKILVACIAATPVVLGVAFGVGSFFLPKKVTHIIEPTEEEKQKECEEGKAKCEFDVTLKEEAQPNHKVEVTTQITSAYDSNVTVGPVGTAQIQNNKVSFEIEINYVTTNTTQIWANFNVTLAYINETTGTTEWTQEVTGYKISANKEITHHTITLTNALGDVTFTSSKTSPQEDDQFDLTITNNRSEAISDANLTIMVGTDYVNKDLIGTLAAGATKILTFTLKGIKDTYFPGITIPEDASFTFKLVRCGAYTVDADNYVHLINYKGENGDALAKEDIPENKFLTKNSYGEYAIHEETLETFLASATESSYELTMLRGEFGNGTGQSTSSACNLKMIGVLDSTGERVSKFIAYGAENTGYLEPLLGYGNVSFDFNNMFIQGRDGKHGGNYFWQGMLCPNINATNCYFSGALTIWRGKSIFKDCTFDSTKTYKDAGSGTIKNNYPMWIYTEVEAEFYGCTFKSIGKAIKVGPGGDLYKTSTTFNVVVDDCDFNLEDPSSEFGTMAEYEYPITADTSLLTTNSYNVQINNCRVNDYWAEKKSGVSASKLYWIKDTQDGEGKANHITINSQKVDVDEVA